MVGAAACWVARGCTASMGGAQVRDWLLAAPRAAGPGLASECVQLLCKMAFDALRARRVEIRCDTRNTRSRAVAERCGFELEGVLRRESLGVDGEPRDTAVYARIDGWGVCAAEIQARVGSERGEARRDAQSGVDPGQAAQRRIAPLPGPTLRAGAICGATRRCRLVVGAHPTPRQRLDWPRNAPRRGPGFLPRRLLVATWPAAPRRPRSPAARRHRAWWRAPPVRSASRR